eukprot:GHVT01096449.1.p2 GENE.GHVT01096449.1~~GHVT01096449.1.p2  ORF type:complete len:107 (+),score=14.34 GHVT01096449.1:839-1159(+)
MGLCIGAGSDLQADRGRPARFPVRQRILFLETAHPISLNGCGGKQNRPPSRLRAELPMAPVYVHSAVCRARGPTPGQAAVARLFPLFSRGKSSPAKDLAQPTKRPT